MMKAAMPLIWWLTCGSFIVNFIVADGGAIFNGIGEKSGCPMPEELYNGKIIYENLDENGTLNEAPPNYILRFKCDRKYERMGPEFIICGRKRKWSDEPPICMELQCPEPPWISNGSYEVHVGTRANPVLNSLVNYSCDFGFEIVNGSSTALRCVLVKGKAVWKGIVPSCRAKDKCDDPGTPPDGSRTGSCCFVGESRLRYSCMDGFEMVGPENISCEIGATWTSLRPTCRPIGRSCPNPPPIANGRVKSNETPFEYYTPYDEVEVVCDDGYAHFGESRFIECDEDLHWDSDFGRCTEVSCDAPPSPQNGTIAEMEATNTTSFPYAAEITYICEVGFRLVGNSSRTCSNRGVWTGDEPQCEPVKCYDPGVPDNGMRIGKDWSVGAKVSFSCFSGFYLIGSLERYCLPNFQWSGSLTRCNHESYHCPDPGIPINGMKIGESYGKGDKVEFRCSPKFSLVGSAIRECLADGSWSGTEALCLGPNDFDIMIDVSETLKENIVDIAEQQAGYLRSYYERRGELLHENGTIIENIQRRKILNLNNVGERIVMYFLFDVSGSVKLHNFKVSIDFAKALVKKVGISKDGARAGALTFSSKAEIQFLPVHFTTTQEVLDELDKIEYSKGGTATSWALETLATGMIPLTKRILGAKGMKSVVFILTDGKANTGGDPINQAQILKDAGVEIYCIGITGSIYKNQLYDIASKPKTENDKFVFVLDSYNSLEWLVEEITNGTVDYSKCGVGMKKIGEQEPKPRILGGSKVKDPWPWMAALYLKDTYKHELKCGGSIISNKFILTAAHCVCEENLEKPISRHDVIVRLGVTDVKNNTNMQEFEVEKIIIHPRYNASNVDFDVAILLLIRPIVYNPYIRPVCLPPEDLPPDTRLYKPGNKAFAAGWGYNKVLKEGSIIPKEIKSLNHLKEVFLPIQERELCLKSFVSFGGKAEKFTQNMFCAGTGDENGDTCDGDSGGPLIQSQTNKLGGVYWVQIGIVSWGISEVNGYSCGLKNAYGYYTNVHRVFHWVQEITQLEQKE